MPQIDPIAPVDSAPKPARAGPRPQWAAWRRCLAIASFVLFGLPRTFWRALVITYFVLALGVLGVRWFVMPEVANYRGEIAASLSQALAVKVEIGSLAANWDGLRPELSIRDLRIFDQQGRPALVLPQVEAVVAWRSLLAGQLRLYRLELVKPDLSIRREKNGAIFIAGLQLGAGDDSDAAQKDFLLHQRSIVIRDAKLSWRDDLRGAQTLALSEVAFRLDNAGQRHRFALRAQPPQAFASMLDVRGDLRGQTVSALPDWRGKLYVALDRADLAVWRQWVDYPVALPQGKGGVRAWLDYRGPRQGSLTADVALQDVNVRFDAALPRLELASLSGRISVRQEAGELSLAAERLQFASDAGLQVKPTSFSIKTRDASASGPASGALQAERLDLRVLAQFAGYLPMPPDWREALSRGQPRGWLQQLAVSWTGAQGPARARYAVTAAFDNLSLKADGKRPGFEALSGSVRGSEAQGEFALRVKKGALLIPDVMYEPRIALDKASIEGTWQHDDGQTLRVDVARADIINADADLALQAHWRDDGSKEGFLDLRGDVRRAAAAAVWRYIPNLVPQDVSHWLARGLRSGQLTQGKLRILGSLPHFPFHKDPAGDFQLQGQVRGVTLDYADGWPALDEVAGVLSFDRARLAVDVQSGRYGAARFAKTLVEIPDLAAAGQQLLIVEGKASGPSSEFLRYVSASPLAAMSGHFTDDVQALGNGQLDLRVEVPLHDSHHTRVKGAYSFSGNQLKLIPSLPLFANAAARLEFSETGIHFPQLAADFIGSRVTGTGRTDKDGVLRFNLAGALPVSGLPQLLESPAWAHLAGQSAATARIEIREQKIDVAVDSSLIGVRSNFPAPMAKAASEPLPLSFGWQRNRLGEGASSQHWRLRLGERAQVQWEDSCRQEQCRFVRGGAGVGEALSMPDAGMRLAGRFDALPLDAWRPIIAKMVAAHAGEGGEAFATAAVVHANTVHSAGYVFRNVQGRAFEKDGQWVLSLAGPDIAGDVSWATAAQGRLKARLSQLSLQKNLLVAAPVVAQVDSTFPALDVEAEHFQLGKRNLGKLMLNARNVDAAWQLDEFGLTMPGGKLRGSGLWRPQRETRLDFVLDSDNLGQLLDTFDYKDALRRGKGKLQGHVQWAGSPGELDFAQLAGDMKLTAEGGQFNKLDPGAGRLLGILSLQALPRRLTLDFRDVFSEGFAFDVIEGSMHIDKGVLHTDDLRVRGPAAKVLIKGRTDLAREIHDLKVTVQPTLSETVAIGIAVAQTVINPVWGLATYLAQKALSDPVEKLFSYDYTITGSWADPKVDKVGAPPTVPMALNANPVTAPATVEESGSARP